MDCSMVDATKRTGRDGELSESDVDDDYDELMLAMKLSMPTTTLSPKPPESTAADA